MRVSGRYRRGVRAVQITAFGGPEVLQLTEVEEPVPGPGEFLVDVHSAGVGYADTHLADDSYLTPQRLPLIPGSEVVGRVRDGELAGRRVLALLRSGGGYAERAVAVPALTVELDDDVTDAQALALLVQGTTAWHLLRTSTHLRAGDSVVVHAAAGGVGTIAVQLARAWGAGRVIGTASGPQKRALVESLGADAVVDLSGTGGAEEVTEALREANEGRPVDVVLEMTGGHVFDGSLAALAPLGRLAFFGVASRQDPAPLRAAELIGGSRSVTGFWLRHALAVPGGLTGPLEELTSMIRAGRLAPVTGGSYPLAEARRAHEDLLSRRSVGKLVLDVGADPGAPERELEDLETPPDLAPIAGLGAPTQIGFPG